MTGFEPRISGVGSNRSTNWATTTAQVESKVNETRIVYSVTQVRFGQGQVAFGFSFIFSPKSGVLDFSPTVPPIPFLKILASYGGNRFPKLLKC